MNRLTEQQKFHYKRLLVNAPTVHDFNVAIIAYWQAKGTPPAVTKENWNVYVQATNYQLGI